jgi:hypothetical protein
MHRIFKRLAITALMAVALPLTLLSATAASAAAAPSAPASAQVVKTVVPMHIIGFDPAVARAHGYVIRTDSHGRQYSVKAGTKAGIIPRSVVYGDCGDSFLYYFNLGNRTVAVNTGFDVNFPAVYYWWKYYMVDKGGTSSHTHSGGLLLADSWSTRDQWGGMTPGPSYAFVAGNSYADLADGAVCTSGGPSDSITITT